MAAHSDPARAPVVWQTPQETALLWRHWDGEAEVIVFNSQSGETHLLDALSAAALSAIESAPATVDGLADRLAGQFALDPQALERRLRQICADFDQLGLIEAS